MNLSMDMDDNDHHNDSIKNTELVEYPKKLDKLNRWTIPSVPSNQIYNIGLFDMKSRFAIE